MSVKSTRVPKEERGHVKRERKHQPASIHPFDTLYLSVPLPWKTDHENSPSLGEGKEDRPTLLLHYYLLRI